MKRGVFRLMVTLFVLLTACLAGCGKKIVIDYGNAEAFEAALNRGENLEGKVVCFTALEIHPDSALGYNVWAGEHLNFVSSRNPDIKEGDTVTVCATEIKSAVGSWIITYERIDNAVIGDSTITTTEAGEEKPAGDDASNITDAAAAAAVGPVVENTINDNISNERSDNEPEETTVEIIDIQAEGFRDYSGSPTMSAYVAVKNNGNVPVRFQNLSLDLEDNDGKLIGTDSYPQCIPSAIMPGQVGYIYTYYFDLTGIDLDNGVNLKPNGEIVAADSFYEIEVSDVSFKTNDFQDVKIIGRGTNNTGRDQDFTTPGAIFYDADNNIVGFCYGVEEFPAGQTSTFEISGDMMSEDMEPSIVDHVEVYIQGYGW